MLKWLREWDKRLKVSESFLEGKPDAREPVDSPAYQWFVRLEYMPMASQLEVEAKCFYDYEMAFVQDDVRYMFDTALRKVAEVGGYMRALESVEEVRSFMQILFLG